jgi:hypothetical protein
MEPTNEELRCAWDELKVRMGLMDHMGIRPFLANVVYSREELVYLIQKASELIMPTDFYTEKTKEIMKYTKTLKS